MALVVEDGSIVAGAESYCSVADATTYHANRGNAAWAALGVPAQEAALRQATDYMVQVYRERWKGFRVTAAQALDWPRQSVTLRDAALNSIVQPNVVPQEIKNACASLALTASANGGILAGDLTRGVVREKVGPIETEYDKGSPQYTRYRSIDLMVSIYLAMTGASTPLVRA